MNIGHPAKAETTELPEQSFSKLGTRSLLCVTQIYISTDLLLLLLLLLYFIL